MISNVLQGAYWIPAQLTGLQEWNLTPDENKYLTDAVNTAIKSMGSKRSKRVLASIDKYAPGASLAIAALIITVPRVNATRRLYAAQANAKSGGPHRAQGAGAPATGQPATGGAPAAGDGSGTGSNYSGSLRPLTVADLEKLG